MTSPLSLTLLVTMVTLCLVECAVIDSSRIAPPNDEMARINTKLGSATVGRLSGDVDEAAASRRRGEDFMRRLLQLSSGLEARRQLDNSDRDTTNNEVSESEGSTASLRLLMKVLSEMYDIDASPRSDLQADSPRKRTCRFNLGGHCQTEEAVNMANQWHFFNSPFSPGRRRRNAAVATPRRSTLNLAEKRSSSSVRRT